ncbi:restriction system protein [Nitrobacteraceae bacterium AZCC 1564]
MTIPDYQTLMLPLLKRAAKGEISVPDIREDIADEFSLNSEERELLLKSGTRVIDNRLHWAKIYLSKAGLIVTPTRGRFIATSEGKSLLNRNPARIDNGALTQYPSFLEFVRGRAGSSLGGNDNSSEGAGVAQVNSTPEEQIDSAVNALQATLRSDLLQKILKNSPSFFEKLIVDLLVAMGYGGSIQDAATELLGRAGDGGVDGVINEDRLGLDRIYVQAKRYTDGVVGRPEVQAFVGSLVGLGASKGVFVTTSRFSQQASDFVKNLSQRIILIDGQRLADLMIEYNVGVRVSRSIEFKRVDEDFFSDDE